ncbi:MAG TPA: GNAT family N-acetyltransferase [Rhizomicrobium sp.]
MSFHPTTQRLILRAPTLTDTPVFVAILGDHAVAKNLAQIQHPFTEEHYRDAMRAYADQRQKGDSHRFAVTRAMDGALIGLCAVDRMAGGVWDFGYWYGRQYWGQGYATEAGRPVLRFAFDDLGAEMLVAYWHFDNPASGHVLEKLGFTAAGTVQRNSVARGGQVAATRVQLTRAQFARKKAA